MDDSASRSPGISSFEVSTEHPRLFLSRQRLRLLRRERERRSARWQQFEALAGGGASLPEEAFALALLYQVAGAEGAGKRAISAALSASADARLAALVFDWCQELLDAKQSAALAARLKREIERPPRGDSVAETRSRVLSAVALAGHETRVSEAELKRAVEQWWGARVAPRLRAGRPVIGRSDSYPLVEFLHAIRDNLIVDLREAYPLFFKDWPLYHLLSYYPASYPAAENEYRIPAVKGAQADLELATMSRAAELAMVAYDNNALENQYLQGWLMHDRFLMRGAVGIVYEFLWANPYQPGLSYYLLPLAFHDRKFGRLYMRTRWDDDAFWLGYFDGQLQTFSNGEPKVVPLAAAREPVWLGDAAVVAHSQPMRLVLKEDTQVLYIVGLAPSRAYDVEVDDEEMREEWSDTGGILEIELAAGFRGGIRLKPSAGRAAPAAPAQHASLTDTSREARL